MRISDWSSDVCSSDLFAGLPFLLKDLYSFRRGQPCGNGSRWLADYRAPFDDPGTACWRAAGLVARSEEHTSELQSLMRFSYAVCYLKKKITKRSVKSPGYSPSYNHTKLTNPTKII